MPSVVPVGQIHRSTVSQYFRHVWEKNGRKTDKPVKKHRSEAAGLVESDTLIAGTSMVNLHTIVFKRRHT
jgi:hypothetical protein